MMRAKPVNEVQNFEKGQNPKKAMGLGIKDYEDYIRLKVKELDISEDDFIQEIYDSYEDMPSIELLDMALNILKNTPLEYQIDWIDNEIDEYLFNHQDDDEEV